MLHKINIHDIMCTHCSYRVHIHAEMQGCTLGIDLIT